MSNSNHGPGSSIRSGSRRQLFHLCPRPSYGKGYDPGGTFEDAQHAQARQRREAVRNDAS